MKKGHVLLALTLAAMPLVSAQTALDLPSNYLSNNTSGGVNNLPPNVQGSPYLTDEFVRGTVYSEGEKPYPAMMRYNAYQDEMQVQGSGGITTLFKRDYVWAVLGGETFRIESYEAGSGERQGYFVELNPGKARLLKRYRREFREGEAAVSSYSQGQPPRFDEEITYYLAREGSPAKEIKLRKKDVLGALSSPEAEAFVQENKLKLKSEEEVIQLLNHVNTL
jgi:hypothetical protein